MGVKVLTIKNPWALLMAKGYKDVENRRWRTNYRGSLLIHSSKNPIPEEEGISLLKQLALCKAISSEEAKSIYNSVYKTGDSNNSVIGICNLDDCVNNSKSFWAEKGQNHFCLSRAKVINL